MNANERFEPIGDLYYSDTHRLRPGQSIPAATGVDSSSDENRARFDAWLDTRALDAALEQIVSLKCRIEELIDV